MRKDMSNDEIKEILQKISDKVIEGNYAEDARALFDILQDINVIITQAFMRIMDENN